MTDAATKYANILNLVNKTLEIPTLPEILVKLNEVMANPDSSADDVANVIATDPAISANILRLVNSAYYGLQVRVSSVNLAVSIMGFNMTRKVALKAAVFSQFGKHREPLPCFDPTGFWKHSVYSGVAARVLGSESPRFAGNHVEDLYICGLLHDIGKIILLAHDQKTYLPVLQQSKASQRGEIEVEQQVLGYTHADVGSVLAIKWFLPEDLTIAIRYHHTPTRDPFHRSLSSLIHLADHLAWSAGKPSTGTMIAPQLADEVYEQVGLEPKQVEDLLPQIQEDFEATALPW
jgi:HD-like signal output (HDOD) protein